MLRIKANAQQMRLARKRGIGSQLLVELRELGPHPRTIIRKRTARINERNKQNLPAILLQRNVLRALIGEMEVRHLFARNRNMQLRGGLPSPLSLSLLAGAFPCPVTLTFSSQ